MVDEQAPYQPGPLELVVSSQAERALAEALASHGWRCVRSGRYTMPGDGHLYCVCGWHLYLPALTVLS